jgi:hypothetical protein
MHIVYNKYFTDLENIYMYVYIKKKKKKTGPVLYAQNIKNENSLCLINERFVCMYSDLYKIGGRVWTGVGRTWSGMW